MPVTKTKKYPKPQVTLRTKEEKAGAITVDEAKEMIGWTEEPKDEDWKDVFVLKDVFGKKIRLANNPSNRPFRKALAERYGNEHLRGEWSINLESIVFDTFGNVLQGQHRLIGLILGEQLREIDQDQWGKTPLVFETAVGYGASPKNADTYDLVQTRSLGDVLYRHQKFGKKVTDKQQKRIATILSGALRLVWLRAGGKQVSFAPHFPHSEALEFYKEHPNILKSVNQIVETDNGEDGNERGISSLVSINYAAALHYLMVSAKSETKATEFWTKFASGEGLSKGDPILTLRQSLTRMDAASGSKRDAIIGSVVKAWLLWIEGKKATSKDIKVARKKDGDRFIFSEFPRLGGIDSELEVEVSLSRQQLVILNALRKTRKELSYSDLTESTGLQSGTISNAIMEQNRKGEENPNSLVTRGLVNVMEYEPQEGEKASYKVSLSKNGKK